ncbi:MAG: hypothetical protein FVQ81_10520 [Candidatus Glassbacteria bacterium]|nr:hypothetical protein [Candidatus Glassbacteria bacterium]
MRTFGKLVLTLLVFLSAEGVRAQTKYEGSSGWFGALSAGGNIVSASANTLGGLGHFSLGVDGTYLRPDVDSDEFNAGSYSAVLRLGILEGTTLGPGIHGVGSLDVYFKAGQMFLNGEVPTDVAHVGGGVRLGILRNSINAPAISVTAGYHKTGGLKIIALPTDLLAPDIEFSTWALRADISKNLFVVTPYAGIGVNISAIEVSDTGANWSRDESEGVFYGGLEWNLLVLHLGIEIGKSGGEVYGKLGGRLTL